MSKCPNHKPIPAEGGLLYCLACGTLEETANDTSGAGKRHTGHPSAKNGASVMGAKRPKYGANKTVVENITFDSAREAERYRELVMLEAAKKITDLRTKCEACVFDLVVNGVKVSRFTADFTYRENGELVVEDLKSAPTKTRAYVMRRKLMKACHGIDIRETS